MALFDQTHHSTRPEIIAAVARGGIEAARILPRDIRTALIAATDALPNRPADWKARFTLTCGIDEATAREGRRAWFRAVIE